MVNILITVYAVFLHIMNDGGSNVRQMNEVIGWFNLSYMFARIFQRTLETNTTL